MTSSLALFQESSSTILRDWTAQLRSTLQRRDLMDERDLDAQAAEVLSAITAVSSETKLEDFGAAAWRPLKDMLAALSVARAQLGFSASETALFLLSLKPAIFAQVRQKYAQTADLLFAHLSVVDGFLDKLALHTTDSFIQGRDKVIARQQEDMLELSTPVVMLWDGILALPLIGTLDSARSQVVMESLLQAIVQTNSRFAIIDITGVATVDTLVAQHLLKTMTAARLMGAECILSGIRPQIAQTIVHLGINLQDIVTKAKLADAFRLALEQSGRKVVRMERPQGTDSAVKAL